MRLKPIFDVQHEIPLDRSGRRMCVAVWRWYVHTYAANDINFLLFYFRRFIVLTHISISPSLASESGNSLIASVALSAYSCARALVCASPSLRRTSSRAISTSPSPANLRPTSTPRSGFSFHANSNGAVARPSFKSAPAGLPSSSPLMV